MTNQNKDDDKWLAPGLLAAARSEPLSDEDRALTVEQFLKKQMNEQATLLREQAKERCDQLRQRADQLLREYFPPDDDKRPK